MDKYTLTFDRGNTSAKLALWNSAGELVHLLRSTPRRKDVLESAEGNSSEGAEGSSTEACLELISNASELGSIAAAAFCSVVKDGGDEAITAALDSISDGHVLVLRHDTPMPMAISYATPRTLGADRLAAALGAIAIMPGEKRGMIVVDLGTAITMDYVDPAPCFRGGTIAPGMQARFKVLHALAPALPLIDADGPTPTVGTTTETAIRSGVVLGIDYEIRQFASEIASEYAVDPDIVLTGGDAAQVAQRLNKSLGCQIHVQPDLIHLGLKRLLEYNEIL